MSRIMQPKTYLGVRVLPPLPPPISAPSKNGVVGAEHGDFPPPPDAFIPSTGDDFDTELVQPSMFRKLKPTPSAALVKDAITNNKWKRPNADSVIAVHGRLSSKGFRMQAPPATVDNTSGDDATTLSELARAKLYNEDELASAKSNRVSSSNISIETVLTKQQIFRESQPPPNTKTNNRSVNQVSLKERRNM